MILLEVLQQLPPQQQPVADAQEVPETPGTPPSIMHVGMKIPITDFFPGQSELARMGCLDAVQVPIAEGIVAYTPDTELPVDENEPIEAGRLPKKKRTEVRARFGCTGAFKVPSKNSLFFAVYHLKRVRPSRVDRRCRRLGARAVRVRGRGAPQEVR